jgi:hypothetical protein
MSESTNGEAVSEVVAGAIPVLPEAAAHAAASPEDNTHGA